MNEEIIAATLMNCRQKLERRDHLW